MLSPSQLKKAARNPSDAIQYALTEGQERVRRLTPHEIGIQGSYETGNIGDRALAEQFKLQFQRQGYQTRVFRKDTSYSNAPIRILGGGGVLHDWYGTDHLKKRLEYVNSGDTGLILGVGAPGFQSQEARLLASEVLPKMEEITVRDRWSKNNIEKVCDVDVTVTACPAFLYEDPEVETISKTGVNFRPYFNYKNDMSGRVLKEYFGYDDLEGATENYINNIRRICQKVDNPVFVPFTPRDEEFAEQHLDIPKFDYKPSVQTTLERVSSVERMVATRYHSLIFSAICGKPVLSIAYEPKVEEVCEKFAVPSYLPHKHIPIEFNEVSNVNQIRRDSRRNFQIAAEYINKK